MPFNYLQRVEGSAASTIPLPSGAIATPLMDAQEKAVPAPSPASKATKPAPAPKSSAIAAPPPVSLVRALAAYNSGELEDLPFAAGQLILITTVWCPALFRSVTVSSCV